MPVAICYISYLAISIGLTIWVARTLYRSGRVFLLDAFHGNADLADSVNHLLVVGFYLINIGYIALAQNHQRPGHVPRGYRTGEHKDRSCAAHFGRNALL